MVVTVEIRILSNKRITRLFLLVMVAATSLHMPIRIKAIPGIIELVATAYALKQCASLLKEYGPQLAQLIRTLDLKNYSPESVSQLMASKSLAECVNFLKKHGPQLPGLIRFVGKDLPLESLVKLSPTPTELIKFIKKHSSQIQNLVEFLPQNNSEDTQDNSIEDDVDDYDDEMSVATSINTPSKQHKKKTSKKKKSKKQAKKKRSRAYKKRQKKNIQLDKPSTSDTITVPTPETEEPETDNGYRYHPNTNHPEEIIQGLRTGAVTGETLTKHQTRTVIEYIQKRSARLNTKKNHNVLHEINTAYQKLPEMEAPKRDYLQECGSEPASDYVEKKVRKYLRAVGCTTADTVPVYKLRKDYPAAGLTTLFGIWIKEHNNDDKAMLHQTCAHEAGHWWHQHSLAITNHEQAEFEADIFAFERLTPYERTIIYARCLDPDILKKFPLLDRLRCHNLKPSSLSTAGMEITKTYTYGHPAGEHTQNWIKLAKEHPSMLLVPS
jgi:uncharacterized protein DUF955